jgi:hypothetical protein
MARGKSIKHLVAFNAGEWSPKLDGRIDLEKYNSACLQLQNFTLLPYGGAVRRPGTQFIAEAKFHDRKCRVVDFEFSTTTVYALEFGHQYIRFFTAGAQIMDGASPYEIATVFEEDELLQVQYVQINDVMYLVHPNHHPQKLIRLADDNWTIGDVPFDDPPFLDENISETTITPAFDTTGEAGNDVTLTASESIFEAGHVGSVWQIRHLREAESIERALQTNGDSSSILVLGNWEVRSYGNWGGDVLIQRSLDDGSTWETIRKFKGSYDRNIDARGEQLEEALFRVRMENRFAPPSPGEGETAKPEDGRIVIEAVDSFINGQVRITAVTSGTVAEGVIVRQIEAETATDFWSESAWSDVRGYPRAIGIYEQRMFYAGTTHEPQTIRGSVTADYENFRRGTDDDDGLSYQFGSQERNQIEWICPQNQLIFGTSGGEWALSSGANDQPLTPSNVIVRRQSTYGSKAIQAKVVNEVILMIQRNGERLREVTFSFERDGYVAPDLTLLAEHITATGIENAAYQQQPDSIYWAVTKDGRLIGMTYEREQNVIGWHRHATQGKFESVACLYGDGPDELWFSIQRTVGGQPKRFIERFNPSEWEEKEDCFFVDSGLSYNGEPETVFSGLDHLEGLTVQVLGDGGFEGDKVVADGQVEIDNPASVVHVGLQFDSILQPMKFDVDSQIGASQGQVKQVREVVVRILDSLGLSFSDGESDFTQEPFRDTADFMDESPPLFSGDKVLQISGPFTLDGTIIIKQDQPLPCTILNLIVKYEVTGN